MRIVFAGTPEFAAPTLRALAGAGHEIAGVITRQDAALGRKRVLTQSPVAEVAAELGLPVLKANRLGAAETDWVRLLNAELGVIVAYGGLVREPLLSLPVHGWINLHFSELPRWRGAAPVQRALMAGEQRLGVTVFRLVAELDAGDVLSRDAREFAPGTSAGEALTELASFGTGAVLQAVSRIERDPGAGEPQRGETSYAHKLEREDGRIAPASGITGPEALAHWAGVTPEPGAFALLGEQPVKLIELAGFDGELPPDLAAGEARIVGKRAVLGFGVGAGAGAESAGAAVTALELVRVQPAGKAAMDGAAWLRGRGGQAVLA